MQRDDFLWLDGMIGLILITLEHRKDDQHFFFFGQEIISLRGMLRDVRSGKKDLTKDRERESLGPNE